MNREHDELDAIFGAMDDRGLGGHGQPQPSAPVRNAPRVLPEPEAAEELHECPKCRGTGEFRSWTGRLVGKCNACRGRGGFKQSAETRAKQRESSKARKERQLGELQAAFRERCPGIIEEVEQMLTRAARTGQQNEFATSLMEGFHKFGGLTDGQVAAIRRGMAKRAAIIEQRKAERAALGGAVDISRIRVMFEAAEAAGLNEPIFRAEGIKLEKAPAHGRNPGAIYVKVGSTYAGKIANDQFHPVRETPAGTVEKLQEIAADPVEAARKYGRSTGTCACCGRKLTDPASVANGIGPICESNWGF